MNAQRVALAATASALLCFLIGGFFLSPLSHGISNEVQDRFGMLGMFGWFASHFVGAPTAIVAWRRTRESLYAVLALLHCFFLLGAGAVAGFVLLISATRFH